MDYSGALVTWRVAKLSTKIIGTEPYASIEMENHTTLFSWSSWLVAWSATMTTMKNDVKYI